MTSFDQKAAAWDGNPVNLERSQAIADNLKTFIPLNREWQALEYGAGTGILSILLKDTVKEIHMMDSSGEMVKIMEQKIAGSGFTNLHPYLFDLEKQAYTDSTFDLIFTQMVLHHVMDVPMILKQFYTLLNTGGYIAIADIYPEEGSFHGEGFTGHKGFDPEVLSATLKVIGFHNPIYKQCYEMKKQVSSGEIRTFPVFMLIAQK